MATFNKVVVMGNLTRDPELKSIGSGTSVCEVGLALNRKWTDKATGEKKEEVSFVDVTMWGRTAEIAEQYLKKGSSVLIDGRLQQDRWEDKETGQGRSKVKIICERMTMVGSREQSDEMGGEQHYPGEGSSQPAAAAAASAPSADDIPF